MPLGRLPSVVDRTSQFRPHFEDKPVLEFFEKKNRPPQPSRRGGRGGRSSRHHGRAYQSIRLNRTGRPRAKWLFLLPAPRARKRKPDKNLRIPYTSNPPLKTNPSFPGSPRRQNRRFQYGGKHWFPGEGFRSGLFQPIQATKTVVPATSRRGALAAPRKRHQIEDRPGPNEQPFKRDRPPANTLKSGRATRVKVVKRPPRPPDT